MAVTRADKETELQMLEGVFQEADAAILIDYKGINVPQVTELRAQLRKARAGYKVVKNTLAKRALKGTVYEPFDAHFEGTTALAYTQEDPVALAKTLTTFMKGAPTLQIKAAVVQGQAIKPAQVTELANLPGKPELYAKLLFILQAPMV
ncbi:MAG: 50S ribosomal protein L10, partial [Vicinamibacterales bacterium]